LRRLYGVGGSGGAPVKFGRLRRVASQEKIGGGAVGAIL